MNSFSISITVSTNAKVLVLPSRKVAKLLVLSILQHNFARHFYTLPLTNATGIGNSVFCPWEHITSNHGRGEMPLFAHIRRKHWQRHLQEIKVKTRSLKYSGADCEKEFNPALPCSTPPIFFTSHLAALWPARPSLPIDLFLIHHIHKVNTTTDKPHYKCHDSK